MAINKPTRRKAEGREAKMSKEEVENVEDAEMGENHIEVEETENDIEPIGTDDTEDEEATVGEASESVIEDWQKSEEDGDNDEKPQKFLKAKKRLKGEIEKKDDEIEKLKAEIEAIKNKKPEPISDRLKRPDPMDYDTDEEYNDALDEYNVSLYESRQSKRSKEAEQQKVLDQIEAKISEHYDRADALIKESGIAPEKYKAADARLRGVFTSIFKDRGDLIADHMLGMIGEGSEKVGYYLGNNESARLKFKSLLEEDPNGLKAAMFLGAENVRLNNPQKRTTQAKPPGSKVSGEKASGPSAMSLKKKYDEAHKAKRVQEAFTIKRQAKQAGVDVSGW